MKKSIMDRYIGNWVIPGKSTVKFQGTLTIKEKSVSLVLVGDDVDFGKFYGKKTKSGFTEFSRIAVEQINGYVKSLDDNNDFHICLVKPYVTNSSHSNLITLTFATKYIIKKIDVPSIDKFRIQSAFFKYNVLDKWVNKYGYKVTPSYDPKKFHVKIEFTPPKGIELYRNQAFKIHVHFRANSPMFNFKPELTLTQSAYFNIEFNHKQKLEKVKDLSYMFKDFFSFVSSSAVLCKSFEFRIHSNALAKRGKISNPTGTLIDRSISNRPGNEKDVSDFLIDFSDLAKSKKNVFEVWMANYEALSPSIRTFLENSYHPSLFLETSFLNYAQALEIFHYKMVVKKQITLTKRLEDLLKMHSIVMNPIIGPRKTFIKKVVKTRNYLTHFNQKTKKIYILKDQEMFDTSLVLKLLMQCAILKELGFEKSFIKEKIKSTLEWQHLKK